MLAELPLLKLALRSPVNYKHDKCCSRFGRRRHRLSSRRRRRARTPRRSPHLAKLGPVELEPSGKNAARFLPGHLRAEVDLEQVD